MNIPIYAGRTFNASDTAQSSIIISKRLALAMYGRVDVVGEGFPKAKPEQTVIGVVSDARLFRLERLNDAEAYFPLSSERLSLVSLVVRTRSDPENLLPRIRQVAREYNTRIF